MCMCVKQYVVWEGVYIHNITGPLMACVYTYRKSTHNSQPYKGMVTARRVSQHIYPVYEDVFEELCVGVCDSEEGVETFASAHLLNNLIQPSIYIHTTHRTHSHTGDW